jgi:hypothetical protein
MARCPSTHTLEWGSEPTVQCVMPEIHINDHEAYPFPDDLPVYWDDTQQN